MNATSKLFVAGIVALLCVSTASAQNAGSEPIDLILVQDQPITLYFPNDFDLVRDKIISFTGTLQNLNPTGAPSFVDLFFDWIDPRVPGQVQNSPIVPFDLAPGETKQISPTFTIPFCPPQVSLDLRVAGGPVQVLGTLEHICVPEPGTWAMLGCGLAGVVGLAYRRRRQK
ncbi:MAG: PEP-CTERM sorting domain-containing protein [Pirellulales bacterium]|nr:PEP-CTERM sorting domain-containing protein [Pirellulales bacterium]